MQFIKLRLDLFSFYSYNLTLYFENPMIRKENHFLFYIYCLLFLALSYFARDILTPTKHFIPVYVQIISMCLLPYIYKRALPLSIPLAGFLFFLYLVLMWEISSFTPLIGLAISSYVMHLFQINLGLDWSFYILKPALTLLFLWINRTSFLLFFNILFSTKKYEINNILIKDSIDDSTLKVEVQNLNTLHQEGKHNESNVAEIITPLDDNAIIASVEKDILVLEDNTLDKNTNEVLETKKLEEPTKMKELYYPKTYHAYFNELTQIISLYIPKNNSMDFYPPISFSNHEFKYFFLNHKKAYNPHISLLRYNDEMIGVPYKDEVIMLYIKNIPRTLKESFENAIFHEEIELERTVISSE